jgi:CRP-like cAMP-binding protein
MAVVLDYRRQQSRDAVLPAEPAARNRLLAALPQEEFSKLAPYRKDVQLAKGKILQEPGEPVRRVYFPQGGLISVLAVMPGGEMVETMTIGREGAIGLTSGIGSQMALNRAIVQLSGQATQIPAARWAELAQQSQPVRDLIVGYNDVQLTQLQQSVACRALHAVEARLCRWLLEARDRVGNDTLPLTQEFLAEMLGVRRTTVTLVARMIQSAGFIHYSRGVIHIRDAAGLEDVACECYRLVRGLTGHPPASAPIYPLLQTQAFEPELIAVMAAVFEDILRVLKLNDRDDPLTTIIARKIIEIVRTGERDPTLIHGGVIRSFEGHGARPE